MTIKQALELAEELRPNELSADLKLHWLSQLDGELQTNLFDRFEGSPDPIGPYDAQTDPDTVLLVDWPYDDIYVRFLVMCIDLANGDLDRYNNDAVYFNRILHSYTAFYAHNRLPKAAAALRF